MKNKFIYLIFALVLCSGCIKSTVVSLFNEEQKYSPNNIDDEYFTLVVLPDTQKYVESTIYTKHFDKQTEWIAENRGQYNIDFVLHAGDIVDDSWRDYQWDRAAKALRTLDNHNIPYILSVGNHDLDGRAIFFKSRTKTNYDKYFPPSKFEHEQWYGGRMKQNSNDNYWIHFQYNDMKFLVISIEFGAADDILEWAWQVIDTHKDHRVIVLTHCYMDMGHDRVSRSTLLNPHQFHLDEANDGNQIWNKLIKHHSNIFMVISGHICGEGRAISRGDNGNLVHEILANYQAEFNGGNGWLRLLRFVPSQNKIYIDTYSPSRDQWRGDKNGSFVLNYEME